MSWLLLLCLAALPLGVRGQQIGSCGSQALGCSCSLDKQEVWCDDLGLDAAPRISRQLARHIRTLSLQRNRISHLSISFINTLPHLEVLNLYGQPGCVRMDFDPAAVRGVVVAGKLYIKNLSI